MFLEDCSEFICCRAEIAGFIFEVTMEEGSRVENKKLSLRNARGNRNGKDKSCNFRIFIIR